MRVERGQRLVEEQHARPPRERARERDALALAAREIPRARARQVGDAKAVEKPVEGAAEGDVLGHGQVREERVVLEDEPDGAFLGAAVDARVEPRLAAHDAAALRPNEARDCAQQRRLARARRADERDRLSGRDLELDR